MRKLWVERITAWDSGQDFRPRRTEWAWLREGHEFEIAFDQRNVFRCGFLDIKPTLAELAKSLIEKPTIAIPIVGFSPAI
jgi:hypothetical protein